MRRLCRETRETRETGFNHTIIKVGRNFEDDIRRLTIARAALGDETNIMINAPQVREVEQAIHWVRSLAFARPLFFEEATSPDDIMGHRAIREGFAPIKVATGEMCQNGILFKQFIANGAIDFVPIDACRLGGLNEGLTVQLMAAKFGLLVWPHAGGVGFCEYVHHLSMIDYVAITGAKDSKRVAFVDHLHAHFVNPCVVENGGFLAPVAPGFSIEVKAGTMRDFHFVQRVAAE